jgi:uncharacterized membrane protein YgdD (TMEM256/DUF423 family)
VPIDRQAANIRGDRASVRVLALAGLLLALATACGAFGAHVLKSHLAPERLQVWDTAVRYQFFQGLGLLGVGLAWRSLGGGVAAARVTAALRAAAVAIGAGVLLFSGSLYALALGAPRALGVLTPLGGIAWIAAWLLFAWGLWRTEP